MLNPPDLPQLESVEARYSPTQFDTRVYSNRFFGWAAVTFGVVENAFRMLHDLFGELHSGRLGTISTFNRYAAVGVVLVYALEACFVRVHKWRTDERGLTARKLLWESSVRWSEVREVKVSASSITNSPAGYRLVTHNSGLWLPVPVTADRQYALLLGSVWQHLRRVGMAEGVVLPERLADLWWNVPDSVPEETTWVNPYPEEWRSLRGLLLIKAAAGLVLAGLGVGLLGLGVVQSAVVLATMFLGGVWGLLWYFLHRQRTIASRANANGASIQADTGFGPVSLRWDDIKSAGWSTSDTALKLTGHGVTIRIPNMSGSARLLLSVLRRLRAMKKFECFPVPEELRGRRAEVELQVGSQPPTPNP